MAEQAPRVTVLLSNLPRASQVSRQGTTDRASPKRGKVQKQEGAQPPPSWSRSHQWLQGCSSVFLIICMWLRGKKPQNSVELPVRPGFLSPFEIAPEPFSAWEMVLTLFFWTEFNNEVFPKPWSFWPCWHETAVRCKMQEDSSWPCLLFSLNMDTT